MIKLIDKMVGEERREKEQDDIDHRDAARFGGAQLDSARPGSAALSSARLGSARRRSARVGSLTEEARWPVTGGRSGPRGPESGGVPLSVPPGGTPRRTVYQETKTTHKP